jgi:hypothetical protein
VRTWLSSLVNAILGRIPGKISRLDTATRMALDADFSDRHPSMPRALPRERDDGHLIKPIGPSADRALFEQLAASSMRRKNATLKMSAGYMIRCLALGRRFLSEGVSIPGHDSRRHQMKILLAAPLIIFFAAPDGQSVRLGL